MNQLTNHEKPMAIAIDIGSSESGYSFAFKQEYAENPTRAYCNHNWYSPQRFLSPKTTTCILFNEHKDFNSFGYEAEDRYSELSLDGDHSKWFMFSKFMLKLHRQQVSYYLYYIVFKGNDGIDQAEIN